MGGENPGFISPGMQDPLWREADTASCGFNGPDSELPIGYGAAFGLYITAWLLAITGTVLFYFAKRGDAVTNPFISRQIDNPMYQASTRRSGHDQNSVEMSENPLARKNSVA